MTTSLMFPQVPTQLPEAGNPELSRFFSEVSHCLVAFTIFVWLSGTITIKHSRISDPDVKIILCKIPLNLSAKTWISEKQTITLQRPEAEAANFYQGPRVQYTPTRILETCVCAWEFLVHKEQE